MKNIASFLDRFKKILKSDDDIKKVIVLVLKQKINIDTKEENIEIKDNSIYLKENHYIKNEIFFKKEEILGEIKKITGKNIVNIF